MGNINESEGSVCDDIMDSHSSLFFREFDSNHSIFLRQRNNHTTSAVSYIRNCSGDSFYVNKFSARCLFFGRGIRDQISRRQPEGIGVSLKDKIRLAPKGPDKGSCICISRCFLGCLDISNHQYLHMIPKHSTTGDFEILHGEFELLAAGPECTVGGTVFEMWLGAL